jgi:outer membrane protein assembly factor BamA
VVVIVVEERPAIASVDFVGIKEFDKDALKKGLKEIGWPSRAFSTVRCSSAPSRN